MTKKEMKASFRSVLESELEVLYSFSNQSKWDMVSHCLTYIDGILASMQVLGLIDTDMKWNAKSEIETPSTYDDVENYVSTIETILKLN